MYRRAFRHHIRRPDDVQSEVDNEITLHLELRIAQLMESGLSRDDAVRLAHERFGPIDDARKLLGSLASTRETHMAMTERIDALRQDLGYTMRQIRRAPGFALAVIATLGLGIGANATMFSAIDQLLLRPPAHVVDPARVVKASLVRRTSPKPQQILSFAMYRDLRRAPAAFRAVGLFRAANLDIGVGADVTSVSAALVSADFFRALGTQPAIGRFFSEAEAGDAPAEPVAVVGYEYWQRELNGDAKVIGRSIMLAGRPHQIIGVAPPDFRGLGLSPIDIFAPVTDGMTAPGIASLSHQRQSFAYQVVARLQPGVSMRAAEGEATAAVISGERQAGTPEKQVAAVSPRISLTSARPRDARANEPEARIAVLLGTVSLFVLLLACANVVNLQLARAVRRRREIAVRVALGVSRSRLIRQLVLDCMVLAIAGGALGVLIARFGGAFVRRTLLGASVADVPATDVRVLAFTTVATILAGLVTGLLPAREVVRSNLVSSLKEGTKGSASRETRRLRFTLLVAQSALATVLLVGTGIFVLSLRRIEAVPLGFTPDRAAVARPNFSGRRNAELPVDDATRRARIIAQFERLRQAVLQTPGVTHSALALTAPFEGSYAEGMRLPGRDSVPLTRDGGPYYNAVSGDYFEAIGARIVQGRAFTESDQSAGARVAIVNETAARLWWPGESALGKCIQLDDDSPRCTDVVGVVQNTHRNAIIEDEFVQLLVPLAQAAPLAPGVVLFGTSGDAERVVADAHRRMQSADAGMPYINVRPLDALVAPRLRSWRLGATMFTVFGALAVLLAAIGLYSVLAYDVAERRLELGLRSALGAATQRLALLVIGRGVRAVATGTALGVAVSLVLAPQVAGLLFRTSPRDPLVFVAVALVLVIVAVAATSVPAVRAARVDPMEALRGAG
jgi:predicted permease